MKIKVDIHYLPLNKIIEIPKVTRVIRAVFLENYKYNSQVF